MFDEFEDLGRPSDLEALVEGQPSGFTPYKAFFVPGVPIGP
jgi:hypothetical protein